MRSPRVCYTNIENQQGDFQNTENLKIFATQIFLPPDSVEGEENLSKQQFRRGDWQQQTTPYRASCDGLVASL